MSAHPDSMFTAGLVQMRSGLSPHANLEAATALITRAETGALITCSRPR